VKRNFAAMVTGPDFKHWADQTKIDRKVMAQHLGIGINKLYIWFRVARFNNHVALGLMKYRELVEEGAIRNANLSDLAELSQ
jgi:hypothetical protein